MQEKSHIIDILKRAKRAIKQKNTPEIKSLSNQTIHSASIYQDPDNIAIAIILYSLSKLIERKDYHSLKDWNKFEKNYINSIDKSLIALERNDIEIYRDQISQIRQAIKGLSKDLQRYVEAVFRKASISKASRLYEHGISLEKTAKILGITLFELNQYVGQTGIADVNLAYTQNLNQRIKTTEDIFR